MAVFYVGLKCRVCPIGLRSPEDILQLRLVVGRQLEPGGQPWQTLLTLASIQRSISEAGGEVLQLPAAVPSPFPAPVECSSQGILLFGESCLILYPQALEDNVPHNRSNKPLHWTVTARDHDRALRRSTPQSQMRQVKPIMVYPHFGTVSYDSNIALMQLIISLEYSAAVRPVCLPNSTETLSFSSLYAVSGWGSSKKDSSGGPLVCNIENGSFMLYSTVRWAVGCACPKKPGFYSRVRIFLDWIGLLMKGQKIVSASKMPKQMISELSQGTDVTLTDWDGMIQSLGYHMRYTNATRFSSDSDLPFQDFSSHERFSLNFLYSGNIIWETLGGHRSVCLTGMTSWSVLQSEAVTSASQGPRQFAPGFLPPDTGIHQSQTKTFD
ncbi:hypothetical protein BTVI_72042 [Pitangus sulphuratus]|nr:hypothetical protein BTVI_72042 [Pitangus sulphuratus]